METTDDKPNPMGGSGSYAIFTSPIGLVRCDFRGRERVIVGCYPLSDEDWPLFGDSIMSDSKRYPELAQAFWTGASCPSGYEVEMPEVKWAPEFWQVLSEIPVGQVISYSEFTAKLGLEASMVRAVASALGKNPLCMLFPCHRIVQASGAIGGYKWGVEKKKALLEYEAFLKAK